MVPASFFADALHSARLISYFTRARARALILKFQLLYVLDISRFRPTKSPSVGGPGCRKMAQYYNDQGRS